MLKVTKRQNREKLAIHVCSLLCGGAKDATKSNIVPLKIVSFECV